MADNALLMDYLKKLAAQYGPQVLDTMISIVSDKFVSLIKIIDPDLPEENREKLTKQGEKILYKFSDYIFDPNAPGVKDEVVQLFDIFLKNIDTNSLQNMINRACEQLKLLCTSGDLSESLGWIGVCLAAANFCISDNRYRATMQKLDAIQDSIDVINKKIDKVYKNQVQTELYKPCRKIINKARMIDNDFNNHLPVSKEKIDSLVEEVCSELPTFIDLDVPIQQLLGELYRLLPVTVGIFDRYYSEFFEMNGRNKHVLHNDFIGILERLRSDEFCERIEDYYYLENKLHCKNVHLALEYHKMICSDLINKMNSNFALRSGCPDKAEYETLCDLTGKMAATLAKELLPAIDSADEKNQLADILNNASIQALGIPCVSVG